MHGPSGVVGLFCCVTLLSNAHYFVAVDATLLPQELVSSVTASTTSTYGGHNYSTSNVFDRDPSTSPDMCNCCWSSDNENNPWLLVDLNTPVNIGSILIKGRSDAGSAEKLALTGLQVIANNGSPLAQSMLTFGSHEVTVQGVIAGVTSLKFQRNHFGSSSEWYFGMCEVEIHLVHLVPSSWVSNLTASSVVSYLNHNFSEVNVFDRNPSRLPNDCNCCWSSANESHPWLLVVLKSPLIVNRIYAKGRSDAGALSNLDHLQVDVNDGNLDRAKVSSTHSNNVIVTPGAMAVKKLLFKRNKPAGTSGDWYLAICELEIYWIVCGPGYYGTNCDPCGHCAGNAACDPNTGHCPGACIGHYDSPLCQTCAPGSYGTNCDPCVGHCAIGTKCDANTGLCPSGCTGNYQPPDCNICRLHYYHYGTGCAPCGQCLGDAACDRNNGHCQGGCAVTAVHYKPPLCQTCVDHYYDANCQQTCNNCLNDAVCDKTSGACPGGCKSGFKGTDCNTPCSPGEYGPDCTGRCGQCTRGQTSCNTTNGYCPPGGCAPGYKTNNLCQTACDHGDYGQGCAESCAHCLSPDDCCNVNGTCLHGCSAGYNGSLCKQECPDGTYGRGCVHKCGHCRDKAVCSKTNGNCTGGCSCGYMGSTCHADCTANFFGDHCTSPCHCAKRSVCDKCTGHCSPDCEFGWTGYNCSIDDNLLLRIKPFMNVSMSSVYGTCNDAELAINGEEGPPFDNCMTCSITTGNEIPWWQLDLGDKYLIGDIEMIGRDDGQAIQSLNVDIYVDNMTIQGEHGHGTYIPDTEETHKVFAHIDPPRIMQYIVIRRKLISLLTICEVRVFEEVCLPGKFGDKCASECHCRTHDHCPSVTGNCTGPCDAGWQGYSCSEACDNGTFGLNCSSECHCVDQDECINVNGICPRYCAPGWAGISCSDKCGHGTFGANCSKDCHCKNGDKCDNVHGSCPVDCAPGWMGTTCSKKCNHSTYGAKCSLRCHCKDDSGCNNVNGSCSGGFCAPGWTDATCSQKCGRGTFGDRCASYCHCVNNTNCDHIKGSCQVPGCSPGWIGKTCSDACAHQKFGVDCLKTCHCSNNNTCNNVDGACKLQGQGCADGFVGVSCSEAQTRDEPPSSGATIGGAVGGAVVLAILVIVLVVVIVRRKRAMPSTKKSEEFDNIARPPKRNTQKANGASDTAEHTNKAFRAEENDYEEPSGANEYYGFAPRKGELKIHELWDYIRHKMANKCEAFHKEFHAIPYGLQLPHDTALLPANRIKNRYRDMYAYDHSRVVLQRDDEDDTDYINACYIDGFEKVKKFIASQGPQKAMVDDFWELVWQQKAEKIVMLTNVVEMGTQKCFEYFPESSGVMKFGKINVKFVASKTSLDFVIRTLTIDRSEDTSLTVKQFHFKSWPDKDVPDSAWALTNFWRTVNNTPPTNPDTPIVVHCSAGIGRTGTFIALDNLYNQAQAEGCVRPQQVVETLRRQRVNMVQTKDQYVYLHEVVAEALLFGTHFVWSNQFEDFYHFMCDKDAVTGASRFQQQYKLIEKSIADTVGEATSDPEFGNVESNNPESSEYRPKVGNRNSRTLQDLGAVFLPDYAGYNVFMTVKSPSEKSLDEFWTVVAEQNVKTVVMLTSKSSVNYKTACSLGATKNNTGQGKYTVHMLNPQHVSNGFTERNFTYGEHVKTDDDLSPVRQFEYTSWKDGYSIPGDTQSMLDLIDAVYRWQPHPSESQPILVHCGNGISRSGIVCVLLNEMFRMRRDEGHINIVDSIVRMKKRSPKLISDADQLRYCYDVIFQHINQSQVYQNV